MTRRFEHLPGVALVDQLAAVWAVVEMVSARRSARRRVAYWGLVGRDRTAWSYSAYALSTSGVFRFGAT